MYEQKHMRRLKLVYTLNFHIFMIKIFGGASK